MRCRELAGVRIRHKCAECAAGEPLPMVAAIVGPGYVENPLKLVQGGSDNFRSYLLEQEFGQEQATAICQQLEVFAARTLFDRKCPPLPSGFVAALEKAREVSHAVAH